MINKHVPGRTCTACRRVKQKNELIRVVKTSDGNVKVDPAGKADGRGAYVCRQADCIETACGKRTVNRTLKCNVPQEVYEELRRMVNENAP